MEYLKRSLEDKVLEAFRYFPVVTVQGARQTGKTTMIEQLPIDGLRTVTFDPVQDIGGARRDPDFFLQNQTCPVFLDEIQYAPELIASIKRYVDRSKQKGLFILSGSQNLAVLKSVAESLAGRSAIFDLYPMSQAELEGRPVEGGVLRRLLFESGWDPLTEEPTPPRPLLETIWRGGYPGLLELPKHLYWLYFDSYLRTYVERDVRTASDISSLPTFSRFIGLLAALTGQEVNANQLGRELGIDRKTALAWLDIAMATFQWHQVPAYATNAIKRIAGKPKGFLSDAGFACYLQRISGAEVLAQHPLTGSLFETYVFLEILKTARAWPVRPDIYHYRAYSGGEVDLLLDLNGVLYPIEVKMTTSPTPRMCRGFDSLRRTFTRADIGPCLIICAIESVQRVRQDTVAIPWWQL
jgi:predicted AAA+ superfamily ATPase